MHAPSSRPSSRDLLTLLHACALVIRLGCGGLDAAIDVARAALAAEESRRRVLHASLPEDIIHAVPGNGETFVIELPNRHRCALDDCTRTLLRQILDLEREHGIQIVKVIHDDGHRQWTYCL